MVETLPEVIEGQVVEQVRGLEQNVQAFLRAQDVAQSSRSTYQRQLRKFVTWLEHTGRDRTLGELRREDLLEYKQWLMDQGLSSYSVNGYLTAMRKFFAWLESEKVFPNIAMGIKGCKKSQGFKKDCLTREQAQKVVESSQGEDLQSKRDNAIVKLLLNTGLRTIEASTANRGDIRQIDGRYVLDIQGKGRDDKDAFVILNDSVYKVIQDYIQAREQAEGRQLRDREPLFASLSNRSRGQRMSTRSISRICKGSLVKAGYDSKRLTAHSFRHTAGTIALLNGATIQQVQAMLRHSDLKTTMTYVHNLDRMSNGAENYLDI